jgi:hypothetical protein
MNAILDNFEHTISELNKTMLPIHKETTNLTNAQENIDKTLQKVWTITSPIVVVFYYYYY